MLRKILNFIKSLKLKIIPIMLVSEYFFIVHMSCNYRWLIISPSWGSMKGINEFGDFNLIHSAFQVHQYFVKTGERCGVNKSSWNAWNSSVFNSLKARKASKWGKREQYIKFRCNTLWSCMLQSLRVNKSRGSAIMG